MKVKFKPFECFSLYKLSASLKVSSMFIPYLHNDWTIVKLLMNLATSCLITFHFVFKNEVAFVHKNLVVISNVHNHNPKMLYFFYHFLFLDLIRCARMMHKVASLLL